MNCGILYATQKTAPNSSSSSSSSNIPPPQSVDEKKYMSPSICHRCVRHRHTFHHTIRSLVGKRLWFVSFRQKHSRFLLSLICCVFICLFLLFFRCSQIYLPILVTNLIFLCFFFSLFPFTWFALLFVHSWLWLFVLVFASSNILTHAHTK